MFGLLKKKIGEFVDKVKTIAKKEVEAPEEPVIKTPIAEKPIEIKVETRVEVKPIEKKVEKPKPIEKKEIQPVKEEKEVRPVKLEKPAPKKEAKKEEKIEVGLLTKIKSKLTGRIELGEKDLDKYLPDFEISLLEADVAMDVAQEFCNELKKRLLEKKFVNGDLDKQITDEIRAVLIDELKTNETGFFDNIKKAFDEKGYAVVLFLGPNGAGKTTTIAKIAKRLKENNFTTVIAAADTWRAASQEQSVIWAERIGVKIFGGEYGSDPAAIGWKAVDYAKKEKAVVLIDSAGRQSTNMNLMRELEKIKRINKPDLTVFIGEAITGNTLVDQIKEFDENVGLNGVILTKVDVDEKGGAILSVVKGAKKPVYLLGCGQNTEDLKDFDAEDVVNKMMGE